MPLDTATAGSGPRRVTAVRHVAFEDLGLLGPLLADRGYVATYVEPAVEGLEPDDLVAPDLVVVLGGPVGLGDQTTYPFLRSELEAVKARLAAGRPTLGVCLGAQLLATALGASVEPTGRREIGFSPLELTEEGRDSVLAPLAGVPVLHWHGDAFAIPPGAARLAATPGFPNQAFSMGAQVLGLQFHIEADHSRIEHWLVGHAHELAAAGIDPRVVRQDARRYGPELAVAATAVVSDWLDAAETQM
jgi:GMP synthase (glutamine-hydrolysing)